MKRKSCAEARQIAFTLIELLVVVGIVGILTSLLLPAINRSKASAKSLACLSNLGQLQSSYRMYSEENADWLAPNIEGSEGLDVRNFAGSWVVGSAPLDRNASNIQQGVLFPYLELVRVFRCPADRSAVQGVPSLPRTRSYSIDCWLNCTITNHGINALPWTYAWCKQKLSEVVDPASVFALIDEHEQSIDGGVFSISQPPEVVNDVSTDAWPSLAADRHNQGCNLTFLDGHAEHWPWKNPKIWRRFGQSASGDLQDLRRLQEVEPHNETPKVILP